MSEATTKTRQAIAEEAAAWFVELQWQPPGRSVKRRFVSWLTESPVHVEEYLAIAKVFGALRHIDPKGEMDAESLTDETVVALHGDEIAQETVGSRVAASMAGEVDQQDAVDDLAQPRWRHGSIWERTGAGLAQVARQRLWASAATVVFAVAAVVLYINVAGPDVYSTRLGELRSVVLQDGSMVSLNTATRIEVDYTEDTRQVRLTRGEALFDVERDPARPFLVETRAAVIRVTGTQFNVYDKDDGTAVTVLEGQVEIVPREVEHKVRAMTQKPEGSSGSGGTVAKLAAGDKAVVKSGGAEIETMTVASLEPVTAWTERRLVFDATPLSEIVQQFNRYNRERLVLADPTLASLELSGVFGSHDPQSLVLFLRRFPNVEVVRSGDGREIRIQAASAAQQGVKGPRR